MTGVLKGRKCKMVDMEALVYILAATLVNSLVSMVGVFSLWLKPKTLDKVLTLLVAFAAGGLLGGAFLHLLAESAEAMPFQDAALLCIGGFSVFFIMERVFKWHHCHHGHDCETHPFTYLILIGDGVHNFIDGLVIAASFMVSVPFGFVTTLMVVGHEIPQELGDFGVLVYGGFGRNKALLYNFLSQLTCVLGGILGYFVYQASVSTDFLLPLAAGGFIYIATSDLIPELHKEPDTKKAFVAFLLFFAGVAFMLAVKVFAEG